MSWKAKIDTQMIRDGFTWIDGAVYGYLWCTANKNNRKVSPSIWLMKKTLCISKRAIIYSIEKLEKAGLIEVDRWYKRNNTYTIIDQYRYCPI